MSIGTPTGFVNFTNGTPRAEKIIATSNIGVGTNSPTYNLDVTGDINFTGTLYQNGTAFSGGGGSSVWSTSGSDIYYNSGNVGIGTTSSAYDLDVAGDINFTGTLYQNGTAFSGGGGSVGQVFADITRGTSSFTISNASDTLVVYNTALTNTGSAYNTSNGQFKPTTAGWYIITWNVIFSLGSTNTSNEAYSSLHKNNTWFMWGNNYHTTTAHYMCSTGSSLVYFNGSTDYAHIEIYQNSGGTATVNPNGSAFPMRFQACWLRT